MRSALCWSASKGGISRHGLGSTGMIIGEALESAEGAPPPYGERAAMTSNGLHHKFKPSPTDTSSKQT